MGNEYPVISLPVCATALQSTAELCCHRRKQLQEEVEALKSVYRNATGDTATRDNFLSHLVFSVSLLGDHAKTFYIHLHVIFVALSHVARRPIQSHAHRNIFEIAK